MEVTNIYKVKVTHIVDPYYFSAQIGTEGSFGDFGRFEDDIVEHCSQVQQRADIDNLEVGQRVLVYSSREKWRRGIIASFSSDDEVDILYLDYGPTEFVPADCVIDKVPDWVQNAPPRAYRCLLLGVKPIARTWISRAIQHFEKLVMDQLLDAKVYALDPTVCGMTITKHDENDGQVKSVGDMLIQEGLAMIKEMQDYSAEPGPSSEPYPRKEIPAFQHDILRRRVVHRRQISQDSDKSDEGPSLEQQLICKGFEAANESVSYEYSDHIQGPWEYHSKFEDIQEQIEQMQGLNKAKELPDEDASAKYATVDSQRCGEDETRGGQHTPRMSSRGGHHGNERISSNSPRAWIPRGLGPESESDSGRSTPPRFGSPVAGRARGDSDNATPSRHESRAVGHGRGQGHLSPSVHRSSDDLSTSPVPPRVRGRGRRRDAEASNSDNPSGNVSASPRKREPRPPQRKGLAPRLTRDQQLKNEYDWHSDQLCHKLTAALDKNNDLDTLLAKLVALVHPVESRLAGLPGPQELEICLGTVLRRGFEQEHFTDTAVAVVDHFQQTEGFSELLSGLLDKHQTQAVKPGEESRETSLNYSSLLAKLYVQAQSWDDSGPVHMCVVNTIEKWAIFNKRDVNPNADNLLEIYTDCLLTFLKVAGSALECFLPSEVKQLHVEMHDKVLSPTLPRHIREKLLQFLIGQGQQPIPARIADVGEAEHAEKLHQAVQASVQCKEECTQTSWSPQLQDTSTPRPKRPVLDHLTPYEGVKTMLSELHLGELMQVFEDNAIRDSLLSLDFENLKEVLKECGLKVGQIMEVKAYLARRAKQDAEAATTPQAVARQPEQHLHTQQQQLYSQSMGEAPPGDLTRFKPESSSSASLISPADFERRHSPREKEYVSVPEREPMMGPECFAKSTSWPPEDRHLPRTVGAGAVYDKDSRPRAKVVQTSPSKYDTQDVVYPGTGDVGEQHSSHQEVGYSLFQSGSVPDAECASLADISLNFSRAVERPPFRLSDPLSEPHRPTESVSSHDSAIEHAPSRRTDPLSEPHRAKEYAGSYASVAAVKKPAEAAPREGTTTSDLVHRLIPSVDGKTAADFKGRLHETDEKENPRHPRNKYKLKNVKSLAENWLNAEDRDADLRPPPPSATAKKESEIEMDRVRTTTTAKVAPPPGFIPITAIQQQQQQEQDHHHYHQHQQQQQQQQQQEQPAIVANRPVSEMEFPPLGLDMQQQNGAPSQPDPVVTEPPADRPKVALVERLTQMQKSSLPVTHSFGKKQIRHCSRCGSDDHLMNTCTEGSSKMFYN